MTQYEQVIDVMKKNGGYATLGFLNQKVDVSKWQSKTPFASIRRIVQDEKYFLFNHSYYQGFLIEIGNLKGYSTYIPPQDKNKKFLDKPLSSISKIETIFDFTFESIVNRAKTIDVIWFNERRLPYSFFEVEHSTDIQNSLLKFNDLQDFYSQFYIVSDVAREEEFNTKIGYGAFKDIKARVKFIDYNFVSNLHTKSFELATIGNL